MSKSNSHRTPKIAKALNEMKKAIRIKVAKREVMHFRIDESSIVEIYEMAGRKKKPVGTMVREWVLERLRQEQGNTDTKSDLKNIERRLNVLEQRLTQ